MVVFEETNDKNWNVLMPFSFGTYTLKICSTGQRVGGFKHHLNGSFVVFWGLVPWSDFPSVHWCQRESSLVFATVTAPVSFGHGAVNKMTPANYWLIQRCTGGKSFPDFLGCQMLGFWCGIDGGIRGLYPDTHTGILTPIQVSSYSTHLGKGPENWPEYLNLKLTS